MKKSVILIAIFLFLVLPKTFAQFEGTLGSGVHAGYATEINSLGTGFHLHYYRTNNIRIVPSFTYFLKHKGVNMWTIDADANYIIPVSIIASFYPIAGIHYSNWKIDQNNNGLINEIQPKEKHRPGLNFGIGFQNDLSFRVRANFELKYQLLKDYSQISFMAGFGFWL